MKTAISISDDLFKVAQSTAKRLGIPRSRLFSIAVLEFIQQHNPQEITKRLNQVYKSHKNDMDPSIERAQFNSVDFGDW